MAAASSPKPARASMLGATFWFFCFGLHNLYLGNLWKGLLFTTFLEPYPNGPWFFAGPWMGFRSFKDDVREANDDPAYDDEVKEKIKAKKRPPFRLADHWYAALMTAGLSKFLIFNLKYNVFPEWGDIIATISYLATGMFCAFCVWKSTQTKWEQGNFLLVMVAGVFSTMALIFLDKGAPPKYIEYLMYTKEYLPAFACMISRSYRKAPHKSTSLKHRKLGFVLFLLMWPTYHCSTNNWIRNGFGQILSGKALNHGLPLAETHYVVGKHAKGSYLKAWHLLNPIYGDLWHPTDKWKRKQAEKLIASFYAEAFRPWELEEITPMEARKLLKVDVGADKKRLHKAYRDASRTWHPDKHPDNVKFAEEMQEKISQCKTFLGYYNDRYEDGLVWADEYRRQYDPENEMWSNPEFRASTRQKEEENVIKMSREEYIPYLAENYCTQMKEMYNAVHLQDLMDLGEEPSCTLLAENIQQIQTFYQGGKEADKAAETGGAAEEEAKAEEEL